MQATEIPDPFAEYQTISDEEVHRRFRESGDSLACEYLNKKYFGRLKREVEGRWSGTPVVVNSAEDIVNRALLEVLRRDLDDREDAFEKLLSHVVHKRACSMWDNQKRKGGHKYLYLDATDNLNDGEQRGQIQMKDVSPSAGEVMYGQQILVAIENCTRCLTDREFSVWQLCAPTERTEDYESIGVKLGITSANARVLSVRARRKIQSCLKEKGFSPERRVENVQQ